jgi:CrcB protein
MMRTMLRLVMLALGGGLGTVMRYLVNGWVTNRVTSGAVFPLGTMAANVTGSFLIGLLAAVSGPSLGRSWLKPEWRDFLIIGFCGGYTTFSSYSLQSLNLARDGEWLLVGLNVIGSNALCLVAVYLGWVCGRFAQAKLAGGVT